MSVACNRQLVSYCEQSLFLSTSGRIEVEVVSLPHTLGAIVTLQIQVLMECGREEPKFKSLRGSFLHIYT